jgi:hypothetical protein
LRVLSDQVEIAAPNVDILRKDQAEGFRLCVSTPLSSDLGRARLLERLVRETKVPKCATKVDQRGYPAL